jgi:hydroxyethylthiazole kinase-like uncharacterized protein yjeF
MGEILTAAQMRAKEKSIMDSGAASGLELMERAGRGVVEAAIHAIGDLTSCNPHGVVLCGPGNNGGDGFVIARTLFEMGWTVELFFWGKAEALSDDARHMHDLWAAMGEIRPMTAEAAGQGARPTFLFDAMFGIGISRPIPIDCARAFEAVTKRQTDDGTKRCFVVAVDCPSGLDVDSGEVLVPVLDEDADDEAVMAYFPETVRPRLLPLHTDLCVTFHALKMGHCLTEVSDLAPAVIDIGLDADAAAQVPIPAGGPTVQVPPPELPAKAWVRAVTAIGAGGHKYDRGHALILGGGPGKGGAARMAARAALRVGAGLVTLAVPPEAVAENAAQLNAIMLSELSDAKALAAMLEDDRLSAICMGPGLGVGQRTRDLVLTALRMTAEDGRRVILDADALGSFADTPEDLFKACHDGVTITPHEGEFARLFPDLGQRVRRSDPSKPAMGKVEATLRAAERLGATVLLKGEATVLADHRGASAIQSALYDRKAPWLGTAGAGDVLAGLITGLSTAQMAQISYAIDLAAVAAWLHVECARSFGPGLIAEDLPEQLPKVFTELGF